MLINNSTTIEGEEKVSIGSEYIEFYLKKDMIIFYKIQFYF
jgi:hypothetical protein